MMNDPQVQALIYQIDHDDSVDYSEAKPCSRDERGFRVRADNLQVRFDFSEHHATEEEAKGAIADYIRAWEFAAQLEHGPEGFGLRLVDSVVVDRHPPVPDPTSGHLQASATFRGGRETMRAELSVTSKPDAYPCPPTAIEPSPDAESMHRRCMSHLRRREPLPSMAYFCLSMLEDPPSEGRSSGWTSNKRTAAAEKYRIDESVLAEIGRLSSTKGGTDARKREGAAKPLDQSERRFLLEAIKRLILRAAERAAGPDAVLAPITLSDLPHLHRRASSR